MCCPTPNIVPPNQLPQIVDRHCCRRRHMPDPNLHRGSIASEDSGQSWLVHFIEPWFFQSLFMSCHRSFHPILHCGWDHAHTTHWVQACDSDCLALCPPFFRSDRYCAVPYQPCDGRVSSVGDPQRRPPVRKSVPPEALEGRRFSL